MKVDVSKVYIQVMTSVVRGGNRGFEMIGQRAKWDVILNHWHEKIVAVVNERESPDLTARKNQTESVTFLSKWAGILHRSDTHPSGADACTLVAMFKVYESYAVFYSRGIAI